MFWLSILRLLDSVKQNNTTTSQLRVCHVDKTKQNQDTRERRETPVVY